MQRLQAAAVIKGCIVNKLHRGRQSGALQKGTAEFGQRAGCQRGGKAGVFLRLTAPRGKHRAVNRAQGRGKAVSPKLGKAVPSQAFGQSRAGCFTQHTHQARAVFACLPNAAKL